jgi:hypothetical protein
MTTIEDRVRQIGRELDRASTTYGEHAPAPSYVSAPPVAPARRPRVLVAAGLLVVACVAVVLVVRRSDTAELDGDRAPRRPRDQCHVGGRLVDLAERRCGSDSDLSGTSSA